VKRLFLVVLTIVVSVLSIIGCATTPAPAPTPAPSPMPGPKLAPTTPSPPTPTPEPTPAPKPAPTTPSPTPEKVELGELKELERNSIIEAEGETLHYFDEKKWAEDDFSRLIQEEDKFRLNQIEKFKATYQVNAGNFDVETNKKEKSTILKCDVYVKLDTWYDFHWFLKPLGLDFKDDHFERLERELLWEGPLDGIKTTILLKFPFTINNCHAHVWSAR
jgi:hypothetical protein